MYKGSIRWFGTLGQLRSNSHLIYGSQIEVKVNFFIKNVFFTKNSPSSRHGTLKLMLLFIVISLMVSLGSAETDVLLMKRLIMFSWSAAA